MVVSGHLDAPATSPLYEGTSGPKSWSERCAEGKQLLLLPFIGCLIFCCLAHNVVTTLTVGFQIERLVLVFSLRDGNSQLLA